MSHSELQLGMVPGTPLSDTSKAFLLQHCQKHIGQRNFASFVAESRGRILGVVLMQRHVPKGAAPWGELSDIILQPKLKSGGVGQMLLARATAYFRQWNVGQVFLETGVRNRAAHRFFLGQGWAVVSHTMALSTQLPADTEIKTPDTPKEPAAPDEFRA